jgi:hypothetical protein
MERRADNARFCYKSPVPFQDVAFVHSGLINFGMDHPATIRNLVEMVTVNQFAAMVCLFDQ